MDSNPCGIPYKHSRIPDANELKGLQVKAELSKLGNAPRSYSEHLTRTKENAITTLGEAGKLTIANRFAKIEKARPNIYPRRTPVVETGKRKEKLDRLK